jgi:hypothetical protein
MEKQANASHKGSQGGTSEWGELLDTTFVPPFSLKGWLFILAGLVSALIVGWVLFPMALYSSPPQPFNFSHVIHTDPDIGIEGETEEEVCLYCHAFREDGTFAGIPKLETCTMCHDDPDSTMGDTEDEKIFLKEYVAEDKEVPWLVYSRQPDCVYFSHIAHVTNGEIACGHCHGDHGKRDDMPVYKENRLTGYSIDIWGRNIAGYSDGIRPVTTDLKEADKDYVRTIQTEDGEKEVVIKMTRMKMDDCAECHTVHRQEQNNACFVCHK